MTTQKSVRAAVIGESAAGKSEFIRSFSSHPEFINSVGKGQTTRSYAEYEFVVTEEEKPITASVWLLSEEGFVNHQVERVCEKLLSLDNKKPDYTSLSWLTERISKHPNIIENVFLHSGDFFDINEYDFLDDTIVEELRSSYNSMCESITPAPQNSIFTPPTTLQEFEPKPSPPQESYEDDMEPGGPESKLLVQCYRDFYTTAYRRIVNAIDVYVSSQFAKTIHGKDAPFLLEITKDTKDAVALFLKVVRDHKTKRSLSSMVAKVKISSALNPAYFDQICVLGIDSVLLVDTYGLDHAKHTDEEVLRERYNKIFNIDYPELDATFFVKKIQAGADHDFSLEMKMLYTVKPNIMTYVVGTYIDKQDLSTLQASQLWLTSEAKTSDYPDFGGKVLELIFDDESIVYDLEESGVPATMAKKRLEVMRSRFAPFCGDKTELLDQKLVDVMEEMNAVSVNSVLTSICDREHLGSGYINIDKLREHLNNTEPTRPFAMQFMKNATERFQYLYRQAGPRTKWRIRVNLGEKHILGYDGTYTDATWYRAFYDAYNLSFTKQISFDDRSVTLSDVYGLQGNEKLAFDELMTGFFPTIFRRCCETGPLVTWPHALDCSAYPGCCEPTCMWALLLDRFYTPEFHPYKQSDGSVLKWLIEQHNFESKCDHVFYIHWSNLFLKCMADDFIPLCRDHNLRVAAAQAKRSAEPYLEIKTKLYREYFQKFDSQVQQSEFCSRVNAL